MKRDRIYSKKRQMAEDFVFDQNVAAVFDDMVERSVPFYHEIHRVILDIVDKTRNGDLVIYDLGCSTGTTICLIHDLLQKKGVEGFFFAVDNSPAMLKICREKFKRENVRNVEIICNDLQNVRITSAQIVIMNYTMQFIPPADRMKIIKGIHRGLDPNGFFILSEKIKCHSSMSGIIEELYYDFKRKNGYSELEISQKREALENILTPLSVDRQMKMLDESGFRKKEMIFRFYNFACFLGIK
ncbi:MAG: carboxy-S-adenosyl-L-methionine synthase CmoA [Halobacteriovoraceae bacterium]|nr:carboxy-S-adenosyl-L-methionine synthase CmoA [Halobacteriovoraceae bacterium]